MSDSHLIQLLNTCPLDTWSICDWMDHFHPSNDSLDILHICYYLSLLIHCDNFGSPLMHIIRLLFWCIRFQLPYPQMN